MKKNTLSNEQMLALGTKLGEAFKGGEVVELVGDVGAGKTTLTKGIAKGLQIDEDVQSPTFTLSREYEGRDGLKLHHYDFYRLNDPGVVAHSLEESATDDHTVTVVEWAETVAHVLPKERLVVRLAHHPDIWQREASITVPANYTHLKGIAKL